MVGMNGIGFKIMLYVGLCVCVCVCVCVCSGVIYHPPSPLPLPHYTHNYFLLEIFLRLNK